VQNRFCTTNSQKELKVECQQKKCIRQSVLNADKNARSHSNPTRTGPFTAENAGQRSAPQDPETATEVKHPPIPEFILFLFDFRILILVAAAFWRQNLNIKDMHQVWLRMGR
jgi:hypothetical protein